mmetsp:Transcript_13920/g.59566  ORF Transcript_13920/g.59566 Transcript_13920/m.59566 type:complete len:252 (+) Transcript_13920:859-1614(+)
MGVCRNVRVRTRPGVGVFFPAKSALAFGSVVEIVVAIGAVRVSRAARGVFFRGDGGGPSRHPAPLARGVFVRRRAGGDVSLGAGQSVAHGRQRVFEPTRGRAVHGQLGGERLCLAPLRTKSPLRVDDGARQLEGLGATRARERARGVGRLRQLFQRGIFFSQKGVVFELLLLQPLQLRSQDVAIGRVARQIASAVRVGGILRLGAEPLCLPLLFRERRAERGDLLVQRRHERRRALCDVALSLRLRELEFQ